MAQTKDAAANVLFVFRGVRFGDNSNVGDVDLGERLSCNINIETLKESCRLPRLGTNNKERIAEAYAHDAALLADWTRDLDKLIGALGEYVTNESHIFGVPEWSNVNRKALDGLLSDRVSDRGGAAHGDLLTLSTALGAQEPKVMSAELAIQLEHALKQLEDLTFGRLKKLVDLGAIGLIEQVAQDACTVHFFERNRLFTFEQANGRQARHVISVRRHALAAHYERRPKNVNEFISRLPPNILNAATVLEGRTTLLETHGRVGSETTGRVATLDSVNILALGDFALATWTDEEVTALVSSERKKKLAVAQHVAKRSVAILALISTLAVTGYGGYRGIVAINARGKAQAQHALNVHKQYVSQVELLDLPVQEVLSGNEVLLDDNVIVKFKGHYEGRLKFEFGSTINYFVLLGVPNAGDTRYGDINLEKEMGIRYTLKVIESRNEKIRLVAIHNERLATKPEPSPTATADTP
jgi:hypothetical protein